MSFEPILKVRADAITIKLNAEELRNIVFYAYRRGFEEVCRQMRIDSSQSEEEHSGPYENPADCFYDLLDELYGKEPEVKEV